MPIIETVKLLQSVEFGQSYWWNVRWTGQLVDSNYPYFVPNDPFSLWFPASTVDEDIAAVESYTFHARGGAWKVPLRRGLVRQIRMTFYDDVNNTLLDWFDRWINGDQASEDPNAGTPGLFDRAGSRVSPLKNCVRQLEVNRLDANRQVPANNQSREYWVYPEGLLTFHGNSASEARVLSVTLVIVGGSQSTITKGAPNGI